MSHRRSANRKKKRQASGVAGHANRAASVDAPATEKHIAERILTEGSDFRSMNRHELTELMKDRPALTVPPLKDLSPEEFDEACHRIRTEGKGMGTVPVDLLLDTTADHQLAADGRICISYGNFAQLTAMAEYADYQDYLRFRAITEHEPCLFYFRTVHALSPEYRQDQRWPIAPGRTWTLSDCATAVSWMRAYGYRPAFEFEILRYLAMVNQVNQGQARLIAPDSKHTDPSTPQEDPRFCEQRLHYLATLLRIEWNDPQLQIISADDSFVDMVVAASYRLSDTEITEEILPGRNGVMLLRTPVPIPEAGTRERLIRGLKWSIRHRHDAPPGAAGSTSDHLFINVLTDTGAGMGNELALGTQLVIDLYQRTDQIPDPRIVRRINLIRAIKRIAESPRTSRQSKQVRARGTSSRRAQMLDLDVVQLRQPERAVHALDASRKGKSGYTVTNRHGVRYHWVSGHERQQWYPRAGEHRLIWIDDHPRGDPQLGTVSPDRLRIYSARGDDRN